MKYNPYCKKPIPILSFPGSQIIGCTVEELVRDGHRQAQCMQAIAERYDTGAAVSLMDLSVEAEAFGASVVFSADEVPTVPAPIVTDEASAESLMIPTVGDARTGECIRGIREAKTLITDRPVWAGMIGPYSLAGRLLDMTEIMILCYEEPEMVETVLEKATVFLIEYAKAFKEAGADGIVMAEPAAGLLSPSLMREFSNPYVRRIIDAVEDDEFTVVYHNCGDITATMGAVAEVGARVYSVGNAIDMQAALDGLPRDSLILGNIDPAGILCNGTPQTVSEKTRELIELCGKYENFVLASGCDIPPATPLVNIDAFFEAAREWQA